jgi:hypothetical protein
MNAAKLRLALALGLFAAWIGWLGYLALPSTTPREVLSHAQFLVSQVDAIARVDAADSGNPNPLVRIEEVHWPAEKSQELVGQTVRITNLGSFVQGWNGPGSYILPLQANGTDYQIAAIPRSPGFERLSLRIYTATPQNRRQLEHIPKPPAAR